MSEIVLKCSVTHAATCETWRWDDKLLLTHQSKRLEPRVFAWWVTALVHCVLWYTARAQKCRANECSVYMDDDPFLSYFGVVLLLKMVALLGVRRTQPSRVSSVLVFAQVSLKRVVTSSFLKMFEQFFAAPGVCFCECESRSQIAQFLLWISRLNTCFLDSKVMELQLLFHTLQELSQYVLQWLVRFCTCKNCTQCLGFRMGSSVRIFSAWTNRLHHQV